MNSFKNIFTKSKTTYRGEAYYVFGRNPHVDWRILLGFFSIVILGFGFFNVYLYFQIARGEFFVSEKKDTGLTVDVKREDLSTVLDFFGKDEQKFRSLKERQPLFVDPSF